MTTKVLLPPCPNCGSRDAIPIIYGYPSYELAQAEERGEIALGGCLVGPESPSYQCLGCNSYLPWAPPGDEDDDD